MIDRRRLILAAPAAVVVMAATRPAFAARPQVFAPDGLAIRGYDAVAYHRSGGPLRGEARHAVMWRGAEWRFASAAHRAAFETDPVGFAPRFGGYCAWAVSRNYTASTAPEAWTLHEGALFLNHSLSVRARWSRDIPGNVARGEGNWPQVLNQ
ncbi:MAG: YHS domain protein [Rhodobacteraceae bacterium]|nr:YHS domain protein [Paracoccaceae bacterium]